VPLNNNIYCDCHSHVKLTLILYCQNRIPGYDVWAESTRAWCSAKEADRVYEQVPVLNDACREALTSVLDKIESQGREIRSLKNDLSTVTTQLGEVLILLRNGNHRPLQVAQAEWPDQPVEDDDFNCK
jgi:hypothetical protein